MNEQIKCGVYIYINIYIYKIWNITHSAKKKEWNNAICSNLDGPRDYHTQWSKSKTNIISLICRISKNNTNEHIYKIGIDSQAWRMKLHLSWGKGWGKES